MDYVEHLTPRNKEALQMNLAILRKMPGDVKTYKSLDRVEQKEGGRELSDKDHYPTEFLDAMTPSGMPPHMLQLKKGAIVMLLRNLDVKNSLCNGTRLVVVEMGERVLQCRFVSGARQGELVLLPRIKLNYEQNLPFVLSRLQYPIRLSFAMTINKSQGQTFDRVGLQLDEPIETPEQKPRRLDYAAEHADDGPLNESQREADSRRRCSSSRISNARSLMTDEEKQEEREIRIASSPDAQVDPHYAGKMDNKCANCGALYFQDERTSTDHFTKCCLRGQVKLDLFEDFPQDLKTLFVSQDADSRHFRQEIRQCNNSVATGSMVAKMAVPQGEGPYTFRLHGQVYHFVGPLHPEEGHQRQFAQIFIMDTGTAAEELCGMKMNEQCREAVFEYLIDILNKHNPFVESLKTMHEVENEEKEKALQKNRAERSVKMTFRVRNEDDQRRYQEPTCTEVAVVFVGDKDDIPGERRITVHLKGGNLASFRDIDPRCDPMVYPLLFPTGKYGWRVHIDYAHQRAHRSRVSQREFYSYYLHARRSFSPSSMPESSTSNMLLTCGPKWSRIGSISFG